MYLKLPQQISFKSLKDVATSVFNISLHCLVRIHVEWKKSLRQNQVQDLKFNSSCAKLHTKYSYTHLSIHMHAKLHTYYIHYTKHCTYIYGPWKMKRALRVNLQKFN